jgi:hypothetical protein
MIRSEKVRSCANRQHFTTLGADALSPSKSMPLQNVS